MALKRKERQRNEGLVNLLLACPVKGWFEPMDRKETTNGINLKLTFYLLAVRTASYKG